MLAGCQAVAPPAPTITSRAEWGAELPNHNAQNERGLFDPATNPLGWKVYADPLDEVYNTIVLHHTALPATDGPQEIQLKHTRDKAWADIGYHFVIGADGVIYEGRDIGVRGSHTGGYNTGTLGIALTGNFEHAMPTEEQLASVAALVRYLAYAYDITHLAGHRHFQPGDTVCPGENFTPLLPEIAENAGLEFGTDGYQPPH